MTVETVAGIAHWTIILATAACIAAADPELIRRLSHPAASEQDCRAEGNRRERVGS